MPDALETVGQDMQQEAANEFVGVQSHDLLPVAIADNLSNIWGIPHMLEYVGCKNMLISVF